MQTTTTNTAASWAFAPLVPGDWRELSTEEAARLTEFLNESLVGFRVAMLNATVVGIRSMRPTCYPGSILAEVQARLGTGEIGICNVLVGPDYVVLVNGDSALIHRLNASGALSIETKTAALDYLRLFSSSVHAESGRFAIVGADDALGRVAGGAAPMPVPVAEALGRMTIRSTSKGYIFRKVPVRYGSDLFLADFRVERSGMVHMLDDAPVFEFGNTSERFQSPFWILNPIEEQTDVAQAH